MRLQISTRLAIFATLELTARENYQLSVADIGEKYGVSSHHLAKVMHIMGRAGLVRAILRCRRRLPVCRKPTEDHTSGCGATLRRCQLSRKR